MNNKIKALIVIAIVLLLIPFGYKQYIDKKIIDKINSLNKKGFLVTLKSDKSNYLSTKLTYKAIISNPQKIYKEFFSKILNISQHSLDSLLSSFSGSELTIDVNILNFPINHENGISIFLTSIPIKVQNMQKKEPFLQKISTFLKDRGLGESLDINALGRVTKVRFKNIDQQFNNKKGAIYMKVEDYISNIQRFDIQKDSYKFTTTNKTFKIKLFSKKNKGIELFSKDLKCNIDKDDIFNYSTACTLKQIGFESKKYRQNIFLVDNISLFSSSKSLNDLVNYQFRYKIKDASIEQKTNYKDTKIDLLDFKYFGFVSNVNKKLLKRFLSIISSGNNNLYRNKEIKQLVIKLLKEGFDINIEELSIAKINIKTKNKSFDIGKIKINAKLKIPKSNLNTTKKQNIFNFLQYVTLDAKIKMTKKDFMLLQKLSKGKNKKIDRLIQLAKINGDEVIFEIVLKDKKFTINTKSI